MVYYLYRGLYTPKETLPSSSCKSLVCLHLQTFISDGMKQVRHTQEMRGHTYINTYMQKTVQKVAKNLVSYLKLQHKENSRGNSNRGIVAKCSYYGLLVVSH